MYYYDSTKDINTGKISLVRDLKQLSGYSIPNYIESSLKRLKSGLNGKFKDIWFALFHAQKS